MKKLIIIGLTLITILSVSCDNLTKRKQKEVPIKHVDAILSSERSYKHNDTTFLPIVDTLKLR